ncbi:undecaprenyldiphospho-muramoylpentapeptide beta-N-acetylglucosaminyltransferase [Aggregatibacter aphrophilus]|uniref:UDP-N-acetylglucosamine--N-acetylmuramyl-(pentapeptide) pyrophosphoryl-undecaprenol N-acetylglucosamine transferase n=1 Tax=Aggregatibacter aphrophilus ATCC 33389 TaxID=985008 RepID=A0A3S4PSF6_AGGAP|nr:undecaprenyldiphospho-muramoylpentapeptide beta-N-acetylglucosaminyltransferase [Aggregatibacter aphrophilus]KNE85058.1 UDP-N-acetylglucosamine-N-acetylmuramyl- (pentapeptide) pyrophosphoryl-UDP acetylglucosamine transferase [Aggregatibacter aphrophilus ATCC 33389]OBY52948.1 undecaprenyldiphospho-muramoylpentapeptide beta-N-acetylglucosaminyltransferase [Aggregatibacter aphrophilus]RDE88358.1 undecaprenyldiphospho-muramoylpentapeptide beta-N-acetylglucosaminyltransferase [Aggregatibacter aphr
MGKKLLVMAGGTGGHVFPAIAVAQELQQHGWEIRWLGTKDRMEAQLVPKHGIPIEFIQISGLRGKGIKSLLFAPFAILRAVCQARRIIKQYQPNAVLGMGGYVSGPGGIAAKLCGVPVVLHEQNAIAGLTNHWLSKIATRVLQAFPNAFPDAEVVGNPVRRDLFQTEAPQQRFAARNKTLRILVVGGSQGARVLNQTVPQVAVKLTAQGLDIYVRHQVGKGNLAGIEEVYQENHNGVATEFIDDMAEAYAWADIVICRSGALTVCELAAVGTPAIFVPFQHKDRQQFLNAKYLADAGAAVIIEQPEFTEERLLQALTPLLAEREKLLTMALNAKKMATPLSAKRVADVIEDVAN